MKEKRTPSVPRNRNEILANIAAIGLSVRGSITQKRRKLACGTERIYHQLQCWSNGKNHTIHVPDNLVDEFKAAVAQGNILERLIEELSDNDTQSILSGMGVKKNGRNNHAS